MIAQARSAQCSASLVKSVSPYAGIGLSISCKRLYSCRAVRKDPNRRDNKSDLLEEANTTANVRIDGLQRILVNVDGKDDKTDKISHGNKGRVPWNKGQKHNEGNCFRSSAYSNLYL